MIHQIGGRRDSLRLSGRAARRGCPLRKTSSMVRLEALEGRLVMSVGAPHFDVIQPAGRPASIMPAATVDSGGAKGALPPINLIYNGGPLLANVQIEPIFLKDQLTGRETPVVEQQQIRAFFKTITSDSYIPTLLSKEYSVPGYRIGNGTVGKTDANVAVTPDQLNYAGNAGAVDDSQIEQLVYQEIHNGGTAYQNQNTLYFVFTPPGDAVTAFGADSINYFAGYHNWFLNDDGKAIAYAVIPDPGSPNGNFSGLGDDAFQQITIVSSHEMTESITDPTVGYPGTSYAGYYPGWDVGGDPNSATYDYEISDLVAAQQYVQDGYEVQYEWSNALQGPVHAPSQEGTSLYINQLTPPAVVGATTGPVATFTDGDTSLTADSFGAGVFDRYYDPGTNQFVTTEWHVTSITGSKGHFVVNATPPPLAAGTYGEPLNEDGLAVFVFDTQAGAVGSGIPLSFRNAPFTLSSTPAPLSYTTDGGQNNLLLSYNAGNGNLQLDDNGLLVYQQPLSMTDGINIDALPGASNQLTVDLGSGGIAPNPLPIVFDGGTGSSSSLTVVGNPAGVPFENVYDNNTGPYAGSLTLVPKAGLKVSISFTDTSKVTVTSAAKNLTVSLPPGLKDATVSVTKAGGQSALDFSSPSGGMADTTLVLPEDTLDVVGPFTGSPSLLVDLASSGDAFDQALSTVDFFAMRRKKIG